MNTRSRQVAWGIIGLLVGIVITQTVIATQRTSDLVTSIRQAQKDNYATLRTVKSCTTPGRPCYERSQRQTARAIASINQITIFAAACAAGPERRSAPQIEQCVLNRLGHR